MNNVNFLTSAILLDADRSLTFDNRQARPASSAGLKVDKC
jgi:hypothetical protein